MALVKNAASAAQGKRADWQLWDRVSRDRADLKAVLGTPAGRRFLWATLEACNVFHPLGHDPLMIHANEGRRRVGLELMAAMVVADRGAYLELLADALKAETDNEAESAALQAADED